MRYFLARIACFILVAPVEAIDYIVTGGSPIVTEWVNSYSYTMARVLSGDGNWDYLTNKKINNYY